MSAEDALIPQSIAEGSLAAVRRRARDSMNDHLRKAFDQIWAKIRHIAKYDLMTRYEVGQKLVEITQNEKKYGEANQSIVQLAEAIDAGNHRSLLYDYKRMAEIYTKEEILALVEDTLENGSSWTWSHTRQLLRIAAVVDLETRKKTEAKVRAESLTVEQTGALVRELINERREAARCKPGSTRSPYAALQQVERYRQAIIKRIEGWDETIFGSLMDTAPNEYAPKLVNQLEMACTGLDELISRCGEMRDKMKQSLSRVARVVKVKENTIPVEAPAPDRRHPNTSPVRPRSVDPRTPRSSIQERAAQVRSELRKKDD